MTNTEKREEIKALESALDLHSIKFSDLIKKKFPPRIDLIKGFLPRNAAGLLGGVPKRGKTWLIDEVAAALISGTPAFGHFHVPRAVNVLLILMEDDEQSTRERITWLLRARDVNAEEAEDMCKRLTILARKPFALQNPECLRWLELVVETENIEFVALDPFREMFVGSERQDEQVKAAIQPLKKLAYRLGFTFLLSHHQRKPPARAEESSPRFSDNASGTGYFSSFYDVGVNMNYGLPNTPVAIQTEYRNGQEGSAFVLTREHDSANGVVRLRYDDAMTRSAREDHEIRELVREFLTENPGAARAELEKGIKKNKARVWGVVEEMTLEGEVIQEEEGRKKTHRLATTPPEVSEHGGLAGGLPKEPGVIQLPRRVAPFFATASAGAR